MFDPSDHEELQPRNYFCTEMGKIIEKLNVPPLIVADSVFPLRAWLMKPYTDAVLSPQQKDFNYRLSRACMVTKGAYGHFKGKMEGSASKVTW